MRKMTGHRAATKSTVCEPTGRRPGRPRAIPERVIPLVLSLYKEGLGYRLISRELAKEGISPDWTTVRRCIKRQLGQAQTPPV
jgi:hypothetical protein